MENTNTRKPISKRLRFEIFKRDSFTCQYCGSRPPDVVLELDHIHPVSKGGTSDELNLVTSCFPCNSGKSDRVLEYRIFRPDADLAYLEAQQEISEANRYLIAKGERDAVYEKVIDCLAETWWNTIPTKIRPARSQWRTWLAHASPEVIEQAIYKLQRVWKLRDLYADEDFRYFQAVIRNLAQEQGEV